jgi:hypothetical protein
MDKKLLDRIVKKIEWGENGCIRGYPAMRNNEKMSFVRRLLAEATSSERIVSTCGNTRCVNVEHLLIPGKPPMKNRLEKKGIQPSDDEYRLYVRAAGDAYREGKDLEKFKAEYFKQKGWSL